MRNLTLFPSTLNSNITNILEPETGEIVGKFNNETSILTYNHLILPHFGIVSNHSVNWFSGPNSALAYLSITPNLA